LLRSIFKISPLEKFLNNIIGSIFLIGMMLMIVGDVTGRYLFNQPIHGTLEITEFVMVAMVYLTLAHTQAIKAHIKVELLIDRVGRNSRLILELITYFLGLTIFVFICWQGVMSAIDAWEIEEVTDGYIPFPTLPAKATIPIGSLILCIRFTVDMVTAIKELITGKEAN